MAKFFLTNNTEWYQHAKDRIQASDFKSAFDYTGNGIYALTVHKLKIDNVNAYQEKNGDFVLATGTAIYKESLDYSVLLQDYNGDISNTRENSIGQYAYVISKKDGITIFGDRAAAYDIYYYIGQDGQFFVSNVLYDMVAIIRERVSLHSMNLMEYACTNNIFGDETIFNEINRLAGTQYLTIESGVLSVNDIPDVSMWPLIEDEKVEDVAKRLAEKFSYKAGVVAKVLGAPTISMTGGLDSRLVLSAFLSAGVKPHLFYGRSNTYIASPIKEDELVLKELADKYGLTWEIQDWDTTEPEKEWDKYLERYGFLYMHWGACKAILESYENAQSKAIVFGFGGEGFRNSFPLPTTNLTFTIDEIVDAYGVYAYRSNEVNYSNAKYKAHIRGKLLGITNEYSIQENAITKSDTFYFEQEFIKNSHSLPPNLLNQIRYVPSLLLESDLISLSRVSFENREGAMLMLRTMEYLMPGITNTMFLTRGECCVVNNDTFQLEPIVKRDLYRSKTELLMKSIYHHFSTLLNPLRNLYKSIENKRRPISSLRYDYGKVEERQQSFISEKIMYVDPRPVVYYKMIALALEKLNFPYEWK